MRIELHTDIDNIPYPRTAESAGFVHEGVLLEAKGRGWDVTVYARSPPGRQP